MWRPAPLGFVGIAVCLLAGGATMAADPGSDAAIGEPSSSMPAAPLGGAPPVIGMPPIMGLPPVMPPPAANRPNPNNDTISVTVPSTSGQPNTYSWRGQSFTGSNAFLAGVSARVADMVAGIERGAAVGSARVLLPSRVLSFGASATNPAGSAEGQRTIERALQLLDDGHVTALRRSGLFEPIRTEAGSPVLPAADGTDFVVWFDNNQWNLRYRSGDPQITGNPPDLGIWMRAVRNVVKTAQAGGGKPTLTLSMTLRPAAPNGVMFTFNGVAYETAEALNPVVRAALLEEARGVQPVANRLGGRLKVVVLTSHVGMQIALNGGNPRANETMRSAFSNHSESIALARVEALRRSRLFDDVVTETADLKEAPLGGFDYVLWEPVGTPLAWHYRSRRKGGDNLALTQPPGPHSSLQQWLEAVRDQLGNRPTGG